MITLLWGNSDGVVQFELTETHADQLALLLRLPIERELLGAGMIVTIQPRDLTGENCNDKIEEARHELQRGLFDLELPLER